MYPQATKPLPIDPAFDIRKHIEFIFSHNTNPYNNFAILMGKLNDAPCQQITYFNQDAKLLLRWLRSTNINPANIFVREECLAFSRERRTKKWFAFLQKNVMLYTYKDTIKINYTHDAGERIHNLTEFIQSLFKQHNSYAGKIYIMDEWSSIITETNLKNSGGKEVKMTASYESIFPKVVDAFSRNEDAKGVLVVAGTDQKAISEFIKRLTYAVSKRFLYVSKIDALNIEYDFIDQSFGKGYNVFIVENAEEYPKITDIFEGSLAGYIQQLLDGKINKAYDEPLIITFNGSLNDFPYLSNLNFENLFLLE